MLNECIVISQHDVLLFLLLGNLVSSSSFKECDVNSFPLAALIAALCAHDFPLAELYKSFCFLRRSKTFSTSSAALTPERAIAPKVGPGLCQYSWLSDKESRGID